MAELVVLTGARAGAVFELPEMPTVVGRSPEAHFQLDDPWISSMHAMFERRGAEIWVVDLESRNGTFVGPDRIQEALVAPGVVLRFGRTEIRIERAASRQRAPFTPNRVHAPLSRPTSRLNAPAVTSPGLATLRPLEPPPSARPEEGVPLAQRQVALLRLALHLPAGAAPPDADLVRAALETLQRAAEAEGGVVAASAGGVLAAFGVAGASPDDADFAVRAARAALAGVENLGGGLSARAAVDAGTALLGDLPGADGSSVLTTLGGPADGVERVLALAGPGEILVGPGAATAAGVEPAVKRGLGGLELQVGRATRL